MGGGTLDGQASIDGFLAGVERRAFRIAAFALRDDEDAMDVVQETMLTWVSRYSSRPSHEWPPLFFKVLQNRIRDLQRRRAVRRRWMAIWPSASNEGPQGIRDGVSDDVPGEYVDPRAQTPLQTLQQDRALTELQHALEQLPQRQQQVFLLRVWQGLDVSQTALAMQCSEGSVKTHMSRAMGKLRAALGPHWP